VTLRLGYRARRQLLNRKGAKVRRPERSSGETGMIPGDGVLLRRRDSARPRESGVSELTGRYSLQENAESAEDYGNVLCSLCELL